MADVYQTGVVATFHRLNPGNLKQMESELEECGHLRPVALVLPSLYLELERPAPKEDRRRTETGPLPSQGHCLYGSDDVR